MTYEVLHGDCRETLKTLPDESVHTVVTSPPYFNLRDYGTGHWEGGDPDCDHLMPEVGANASSTLYAKRNDDGTLAADRKGQTSGRRMYSHVCGKCGARRVDSQIGLEPTPQGFVDALVDVFREIKRVLHPSGTVWLNLGDTYGDGKQLLGIPWRVAFALQNDGWILRQDIIWNKPNCMPEPVKDRCTKNHEYIFLLSKSKSYFYDHNAIREPLKESSIARATGKDGANRSFTSNHPSAGKNDAIEVDSMWGRFVDPHRGANKRTVWTVTTKSFRQAHFATYPPDLIEPCILAGTSAYGACGDCGTPWERVIHQPNMSDRPVRSADAKQNDPSIHVSNGWAEHPKSSGTEYQKWRDENPDRTVGWRPGCECHGKLVREEVVIPPKMTVEEVVETSWATNKDGSYRGENVKDYESAKAQGPSDVKRRIIEGATKPKVRKEWVYYPNIPLEEHPVVPCTVLDPFGGSGTTAGVAIKHGRQAVLCELNPEYAELIDARIRSISEHVEEDVADTEWL